MGGRQMRQHATTYRKEIKQLKQHLSAENLQYFEDFYESLQLHGIRYSEADLNQNSYNYLLDLVDAQKDGMTAWQLFGSSPDDLGKNLVVNMKKMSSKSQLNYMFLGSFLVISGILASRVSWTSSADTKISLVYILVMFAWTLLFVGFILKIFTLQIKLKNKVLGYLILWLYCSAFMTAGIFAIKYLTSMTLISVPIMIGRTIVIVGGICNILVLVKLVNNDKKQKAV